MISKRFYLFIVLAIFIAVFAATPQQKAVFAAGTVENPEGSYRHLSIALIFPDNASRAITNAQDYNRKTGAEIMDLNAIFTDLTTVFQRNFKSVVRVKKMEEAKALKVDLVAVLDLRYTLPDTVDNDVKYDVSAAIMTPAQVKIDTIRGSSVKSPSSFPFPHSLGSKRIGDAIKVAAIEAEYRMEDALHSSVKIAAYSGSNQASNKEASSTSPTQTTADKSGLIASSSVEKTSTTSSSEQTATVKSESAASPLSKQAQRTRSSKRAAMAESSPFSKQVTTELSPTQSETVIPEVAARSSSKEAIPSPAPVQKGKSASKGTVGATSKKASAALSASPEQMRTGKSEINNIPSVTLSPDTNAYAIVIGVEEYRQKLPKAVFATHDAQAVAESLTKVMGYPADNVITLINDQATHADVAKYVEKWLLKNVKSGSTVFIYFSGLGTSNPETGEVFLVPYDGDPSFIDQTGYSLKRMSDALKKLPAKEIIVVLDSCFSGTGGKSVLAEGARPVAVNLQKSLALSGNMTVLSAVSGDQACSSYQAKSHSLFTYYMLRGIRDEDVMRTDGSLDVRDLFAYARSQVERIARKKNNSIQSPQLMDSTKN